MLSEKKKNRCAADSGSSSYSVFRTAKQILPMQRQSRHFLPRITASVLQMGTVTVPQSPKPLPVHSYHLAAQGKPQSRPARQAVIVNLRQHRIIPALRLKHRSGGCGTASALPKCSIMSGCGTRIVLRFAVSATGGAHLCSIQYYLRFWLSSCRTSLAVSALKIVRCCPTLSWRAHNVHPYGFYRTNIRFGGSFPLFPGATLSPARSAAFILRGPE